MVSDFSFFLNVASVSTILEKNNTNFQQVSRNSTKKDVKKRTVKVKEMKKKKERKKTLSLQPDVLFTAYRRS